MPNARRRALRDVRHHVDGTPLTSDEALRFIRWANFRLSRPVRAGEEVEISLARVIVKYEIALQLATMQVSS
jgi:hypothetical protein